MVERNLLTYMPSKIESTLPDEFEYLLPGSLVLVLQILRAPRIKAAGNEYNVDPWYPCGSEHKQRQMNEPHETRPRKLDSVSSFYVG